MNKEPYFTDTPVHPGEHLKDTIIEFGITQGSLAKRLGKSRKFVNEIINGKTDISASTATLLGCVLDMPPRFWLNLQQQYDLNVSYNKEKARLSIEADLIKNFPVNKMVEYGWVKKAGSKEEKVMYLYHFFRVSSLKDVENSVAVRFRRSLRDNTSKEAVLAWLRQGEKKAENIQVKKFDGVKLRKILPELRALTVTDPNIFQSKVVSLCADSGVAVAFVPGLPKTFINGATFRTSGKTVILLSLRFKTNDHLWFSFFHEVGHILLHSRKINFLDQEYDMLNGQDKAHEDEADNFAADILIPKQCWQRFIKDGYFTKTNVCSFANSISIDPGIVVGRLQREGKIEYSKLNSLKKKYEWNLTPP